MGVLLPYLAVLAVKRARRLRARRQRGPDRSPLAVSRASIGSPRRPQAPTDGPAAPRARRSSLLLGCLRPGYPTRRRACHRGRPTRGGFTARPCPAGPGRVPRRRAYPGPHGVIGTPRSAAASSGCPALRRPFARSGASPGRIRGVDRELRRGRRRLLSLGRALWSRTARAAVPRGPRPADGRDPQSTRLIAKDRVTSALRAPFTEFEDDAGPGEVSGERPRPRATASGRRARYMPLLPRPLDRRGIFRGTGRRAPADTLGRGSAYGCRRL